MKLGSFEDAVKIKSEAFSKRYSFIGCILVRNRSYPSSRLPQFENESSCKKTLSLKFDLFPSLFSYKSDSCSKENICTGTCFKTEAERNLEMAYWTDQKPRTECSDNTEQNT